jgi:hypothetical protein
VDYLRTNTFGGSSTRPPLDRTIEFSHTDKSVNQMFNRYSRAQNKMAEVFSYGGDFDDDIPF